jgi:hypothetical protein
MSGPSQMKSAVLMPDFAARVGSLPDIRAYIVTIRRDGTYALVVEPQQVVPG